jgi:hypothetical protein
MADVDREGEATDLALDWIHSTFARTVALKIIPLLLPTIGIVLAWLQDAIGLDIDPTVVATVLGSALIGAAGIVLQWVRNHGRGATQLSEALLHLQAMRAEGERHYQQAATTGPETTFGQP